jgi:hypothetical protein
VFFHSISEALAAFLNWRPWVLVVIMAAVSVFIFYFTPILLAIGPSQQSEDAEAPSHPSLQRILVARFVGAFIFGTAIALVVFLGLPFLLKGEPFASLAQIRQNLGQLILAGLLGSLVGFTFTLIPVLGRMVAALPFAQIFVIELTIFHLLTQGQVAESLLGPNHADQMSRIGFTDLFLPAAGFLFIGLMVIYILFMATGLILATVRKRSAAADAAEVPPNPLVAYSLQNLIAVLALLMLSRHAAQLAGL